MIKQLEKDLEEALYKLVVSLESEALALLDAANTDGARISLAKARGVQHSQAAIERVMKKWREDDGDAETA